MKVCYLTSRFVPKAEGLTRYTTEIIYGLAELGCKLDVFARSDVQCNPHENINIFPIPESRNYFVRGYLNVFDLASKNWRITLKKYDIIHSEACLGFLLAIKKRLVTKGPPPFITTMHGSSMGMLLATLKGIKYTEARERVNLYGYMRDAMLERVVCAGSDEVIATCNLTKKLLVKHYFLDPQKIVSIYNGVDTSKFKPINGDIESQEILFVGRLTVLKGVHLLIQAMREVVKKHPYSKLRIIGSGPQFPVLRNLVNRLNLSRNVDFLGFLSGRDLIECYTHCALVALPSLYEGFGLTIIEGMACGKPVITTTNTVAPEIMTNGKDGLIIAPNNVKQLAEKIDYLLSNPDIAKKIGKEASRTIRRKNLTWKNCAKQIYERYISILNR